jgi:hypothetical protein
LVSFITNTGALGWSVLVIVILAVTAACCYCAINDRIRERKE